MTAVYALNVAADRTPAEIDAVLAGLTNTLAVVARYGDQHHVGRCHEMLAQASSWRGSHDELIQHLKAAHDAYLGAEAPWFAARPAAALAEFALQSGDAAAASAYAREALTHGVDVDRQEAAMTASLLVEALTRQPDRALELADAALSAAARWEGLSEPDTLHNTFNAARAYVTLGRHSEAAALFAEAMPRVSVPYDPAGVAMTREQYARSLRAIGQHAEAAEQFLEAARIVAGDPAKIEPQASLAASAAESLRKSGQDEAALAAFRRAAVLFGEAGNVVNRVRCLRSAAWLEFFAEADTAHGTDRAGERTGIATMTSVLVELEALAIPNAPAELAMELANTRDQLAEMVNELAGPGSGPAQS
jgi:tetratricopeptide (TPR) repeat protein